MSDFNLALQIDELKKQEKHQVETKQKPEQLVSFRGESAETAATKVDDVKIEMPKEGKLLPPKTDEG